MTGEFNWEDIPLEVEGREEVKFSGNECPLCGDKGYTISPMGDCIEYQQCLCVSQQGESKEDG